MAKMMTIPEKMLEDVKRMSDEVLGLKVPAKPTLLTYDRQKFAVNFLNEEITEFQHAWDMGNVPEAADAMIDLVYVALGRLIEMGIPPGPIFEEVHSANMKKHKGRTKRGVDTDAAKPEGWMPPDHSWLLTVTAEDIWEMKKWKAEKILQDIAPIPLKGKTATTVGSLSQTEEVTFGEPVNTDSPTFHSELAKKKNPLAKPQTALIPYESTVAQAQAMAYGAYVKYKPWDWTKGRPFTELLSSIDHHLAAWADRERDDPESKAPHLGHAQADIGMLIAFEAMGRTDLDDRRPVHTITMHTPTEEAT